MRRGRNLNKLGMAHSVRRCAYNSRFLACSSGLCSVLQLRAWSHSQCFNNSARTLAHKTTTRLKVNRTIADDVFVASTSSLESGIMYEALRSWLEIWFKMPTIATSPVLSAPSCWRVKLIYIERTAAKRPDYLDFSYRDRKYRERGRRTKISVLFAMSCHTISFVPSSLAANSL